MIEILRRWKNRIKKGWHTSDTWDFDVWFCDTISQMLRYIAKNTSTCPSSYKTVIEFKADLNETAYILENYVKWKRFGFHRAVMSLNHNLAIERDKQMIENTRKAIMWIANNFEGLWW